MRIYCGPYTVLYGHGGLRVGDDVMIAGQCMLIPANHKFNSLAAPIAAQGKSRQGIVIGDNVWLGCGVRILDGVNVGEGAVVAAGSVVTGDVPPRSVVAGVPGRLLKSREERALS